VAVKETADNEEYVEEGLFDLEGEIYESGVAVIKDGTADFGEDMAVEVQHQSWRIGRLGKEIDPTTYPPWLQRVRTRVRQ